jgi:hypothetical protein
MFLEGTRESLQHSRAVLVSRFRYTNGDVSSAQVEEIVFLRNEAVDLFASMVRVDRLATSAAVLLTLCVCAWARRVR